MAIYYALSHLNSTQYSQLRLILGDQLNASHSWLRQPREDTLYVMMEMRQETDYVRHHRQKVLAFFAAMRNFANAIAHKHDVLYLTLDHQGNKQHLTDNLDMVLQHTKVQDFAYQAPDEWRLDEQLARYRPDGVSVSMVDTEHFLTARDALGDYFKDPNKVLLETFYRRLRKQYNYLMDGDKPAGGKWNYDHDNRKKLPEKVQVPTPLVFDNDVSELDVLLTKQGVDSFGEVDATALPWPVSRKQSRELLNFFLEHGLANFGRYQDAMSKRCWSLFHSRLSFSMNSKMLSPREVIESAIEAHHKQPDVINLAQIEGFVRQILGWREFVRAIYWDKMPDYANLNKLQHERALPEFYWTGDTKMACLQHAIRQSLQYAYAHHIQRLMITGNFALLTGADPDAVDAWYLGIYVDAIEWVELPNTRGMSQFADGGILATKPYVSGGNYINNMGHYCKDCHYDVKQKHGEGSCPFNVLYWHFLDRHQQLFANNQRMSMMYRQWEKRESNEREAILATANDYLIHLETL